MGGSEVSNSFREQAIKAADGSRQRVNSFEERAIKGGSSSHQGASQLSILLPTRIPQHRHLISMRQKHNHHSSQTGNNLEPISNPDLEEEDENKEEDSTTISPINIFDGQYHEDNPGQYHEKNPGQYEETDEGQYLEINPGQYEAVVEYNVEEETKSYNVHRKTGD